MAIVKWLQVRPEGEIGTVDFLRNKDLIPMGPHRRLWGFFSFVSYWAVSECCISTWSGAASLLSIGLNVGETMGIVLVGNCIIASLAIFNSAPGYYYHVGFTVSQRLIFGIKGSYFGIAIRTILSIVWYASQAWMGGLCLGLIFSSWSESYLNMKNTFPASVNMSTRDLISFLIFQLISIPLLCVKPEKLSPLLKFSSAATFFGMLGTFIWSISHNGGVGPLFSAKSTFSSRSDHAWAWIYGITSWYGSLSAGVTNQCDFTRFSRTKWISIAPTVVGVVALGTIVPLFGIFSASATTELYGEAIWMPNKIAEQWLIDDYSPKSRAGAFFAGICFLASQLALNLIGNGMAGGMDMAGLFPKYINIRRGAIITSLLSWVIQPWLFYNTSSTFVTVMSSFSVFMSPIIGILVSEFWVVRKTKLKLSDLYTFNPDGNFWYWKGVNIKTFVVFFIASTPGLPGLIHGANPSISMSTGILNYYQGNCMFGFAIAFSLNVAANYVFPPKNIFDMDTADKFDTYTAEECSQLGLTPYSEITPESDTDISYENLVVTEKNIVKEEV
ncbi:thiamine metabolism [Scheffersomyces amazonensis]|uniref:thiamine metabolism n=1 Tax=Scheffersomyces amazonensis TaxID=1078765 RepID=UPI00315DC300